MTPIEARLKRACVNERDRYPVGMRVGLPRVTVDLSDLEHALAHLLVEQEVRVTAERERDEARAEVERLRERLNRARGVIAEGLAMGAPQFERWELEDILAIIDREAGE